jgi:hypothetical protein
VEQERKQARLRAVQRQTADRDARKALLLRVGKVAGLILIVGLGVLGAADITRQLRYAKQRASRRDDEEGDNNDWEL